MPMDEEEDAQLKTGDGDDVVNLRGGGSVPAYKLAGGGGGGEEGGGGGNVGNLAFRLTRHAAAPGGGGGGRRRRALGRTKERK